LKQISDVLSGKKDSFYPQILHPRWVLVWNKHL
jgi:hypothetical protein